MTNVSDTLRLLPQLRTDTAAADHADACLVYIYPTGPLMGFRFKLGKFPSTLGRDSDCDIRLDEISISRRHARIEPDADGFVAIDLASTNGTFVNDRPTSRCKIADGDYLRVGNCILRFLAGGNVEAEYHEEIYRLTILDGLTGIYNHRFLIESLDRELARAMRFHRPLSVLLFDLDHFKEVNDRIGHLGGDHVLRELAACVQQKILKEEVFARYGGEEFIVVLPEVGWADGLRRGEEIRDAVEKHPFQFDGECHWMTISVGVFCTQGDDLLTAAELIKLADYNLYQAKRAGRNRVFA